MARGSATASGRVTKSYAAPGSSRSAPSRMSERQRSKMAVEASSSDVGNNVLQDMVDEATIGLSQAEPMDWNEAADLESPVIELEEKKFPLMLLPAEIRNEIYRACLTRPFNILLSRKEQPQPPKSEPKEDVDEDEGGPSGAESRPEVVDLTQGDSEGESDGDVTSRSARAFLRRNAQRLGNAMGPTGGSSSSPSQPTISRVWASRGSRSIRLLSRSSASSAPGTVHATSGTGMVLRRATSRSTRPSAVKTEVPREARPQDADPLIINLLRVSKTVYYEARSILYNENLFTLDLDNAVPTLAALHQRSRRQIKHIEVEIPCYNEILERFQETVRLSLRYCWGLKKLVIHMPFTLPGADGSGTTGNTTVYANGFDILRWLPRQCEVVLKGNVCAEIVAVVEKNATLAKTLDEDTYAMRQLKQGMPGHGWVNGCNEMQ